MTQCAETHSLRNGTFKDLLCVWSAKILSNAGRWVKEYKNESLTCIVTRSLRCSLNIALCFWLRLKGVHSGRSGASRLCQSVLMWLKPALKIPSPGPQITVGGGQMNRHDLKDSFLSHFSQNSLGRLLTAKERDTARSVFLGLGLDKDGVITRADCRQAQQSWFHKLNKDCQSCNVRWVSRSSQFGAGLYSKTCI